MRRRPEVQDLAGDHAGLRGPPLGQVVQEELAVADHGVGPLPPLLHARRLRDLRVNRDRVSLASEANHNLPEAPPGAPGGDFLEVPRATIALCWPASHRQLPAPSQAGSQSPVWARESGRCCGGRALTRLRGDSQGALGNYNWPGLHSTRPRRLSERLARRRDRP